MSAHCCDVIVIFFCGTTGNNDPDLLGSDESELVIIAWQLIDLSHNQAGDIHYIYAKHPDDRILDEQWQKDTGITYQMLEQAPTVEDAIFQFEQTLRNELNDQEKNSSFTLCTDGQCHLRQVLHPASTKNNLILPDFCFRFFDLKKEFNRCRLQAGALQEEKSCEDHLNARTTTTGMLDYLNVTVEEYGTFGVDHVRKMSAVVQVMISEQYGHIFDSPEKISAHLDTGPCITSETVDDETIVRARGLPWQASDHDVARFFRGLNISRGGAALVLNPQGRRNGEAIVRFESSEHRDLALLRHKHHMGNRYIEVYRASGEEFLRVATGSSVEALSFLSKQGEAIVRMRGLPFTASATDIVDFFGENIPVTQNEEGVLFVKHGDGRPTGDAFVLFPNEKIALEALSKHKETLGKRYVEIFKSTAAEVQQVLNRHMTNHIVSSISANPLIIPHLSSVAQPSAIPPQVPINQFVIQPAIPPGAVRNCIRLRGMPYSATVDDVINFLGELSNYVLHQGIYFVLNQQGRPSGDAFIQLSSAEKAAVAGLDVSKGGCHKKHMGERYVEVFQCSGDEMNIVLMGGSLNRNGMMPPPGMAIIASETTQPAVLHPPPPIPSQTAPAAPIILQTPQGAVLMQQPMSVNGGFGGIQQIDMSLPIIAAPRTSIIPQPAFFTCGQYLPTPPVSPTSPNPSLVPSVAPSVSPGVPRMQVNKGSKIHVRLQGMPFNASVHDVAGFLKEFNLEAESIRIIYNDKLRPTGDAIVSFVSFDDANKAVLESNRKLMGGSFVDVSICGVSE